MTTPLAFVICTEEGPLERLSTLFARSLRTFGGTLRDAPIYSIAPRPGRDIRRTTYQDFDKLGVTHRYIPLNIDFQDYKFANKLYAASYAEANIDSEIIVFADSDLIFLKEPAALLVPPGYDVALRPEDMKGVGVTGEEDTEYPYWRQLYNLCNVTDITYVETPIDKQRIYGYWQAGLAASRRTTGLFSLWRENFTKVMRSGIKPASGIFFVEMTTFAASVSGARLKVSRLPDSYNYPLHLHHQIAPSERAKNLRDLTVVHYHRAFNNATGAGFARHNPLTSFLTKDEQSAQLVKMLDETGVYPQHRVRRLAITAEHFFYKMLQVGTDQSFVLLKDVHKRLDQLRMIGSGRS
jgi:hypothetical protein